MASITDQYALAKNTLTCQLYAPHQTEGVYWMLSMENQSSGPRGGFLCDEMGLGKTIQTIATFLGNPQKNTLVVVPKSIVNQWVEEINKFAPQLKVTTFDGPKRTDDSEVLKEFDVVVAPYSMLKSTVITNILWGRVVLDEAHEIRNKQAKVFKFSMNLKSEIKWLLTGTPVFNSMKDFVSLCNFLGFPKELVQAMPQKLKDIYILRRKKTQEIHAPRCYFENVELEMFKEEKELYQFVFLEAQDTIRKVIKSKASKLMKNMFFLECLLRTRQVLIWPQMYYDGVAKKEGETPELWTGRSNKMETLFRNIESHPEEKTIVFCQFMGEMNYIQSHLTCPVFRIDGSKEKFERIEELKEFNYAPQNSVLLVQIKCGGQGLNIQCASRVYITAPAWNPATELQAIGRCHRSGQTKDVHVKKLVYDHTEEIKSVEKAIMALQKHKSFVCSEVLNDESLQNQIPISGPIGMDAIKKIFKYDKE